MSARDDYPSLASMAVDTKPGCVEAQSALDEIDRLRNENEQLRANYGLGICQSCAQPVNAD